MANAGPENDEMRLPLEGRTDREKTTKILSGWLHWEFLKQADHENIAKVAGGLFDDCGIGPKEKKNKEVLFWSNLWY